MRYLLVALACSPLTLAHCTSNDSGASPPPTPPVTVPLDAASDVATGDAGTALPSTCAPPSGAGVTHEDSIAADETWRASDGPHIVTFGIDVQKGATLTIEPCAVVRVRAGYSIVVEGNLNAVGTETNPIAFVADDAASPWGSIEVFAPGTAKLAYATLSDGGGGGGGALGAIEARGDQLAPAQGILAVDHVTVSGSASYGVSLRAGAAFTADSQALTITKSKKAAMRLLPRLATNVPTGAYVGNAEDAFVVETEAYGDVDWEDVTFHDRGVPYRVGVDSLGALKVGPKHFTLTLEAGVKLAFKKSGVLVADHDVATTGVIVASGTAAKPVVFTSSEASPAAGDWQGVQLGTVADAAFKLDHVEIRFAGGASQASSFHCEPNPTVPGAFSTSEDAALAIYHQPAKAYLTNSLIADSARDGVDNAYTGTLVDSKATNTFTNVAGCAQTLPRPSVGQCPDVGCP
jgi:hypothetical protein